METKGTNKVLVGIAIFLAVVIIVLLGIIIYLISAQGLNDKGNAKNEAEMTTEKTEEGTTEATETEEETTEAQTTEAQTTEAQTTEAQTTEEIIDVPLTWGPFMEPDAMGTDIYTEGGVYLSISEVNDNRISFQYTVVQAPPSNRIAVIEVKELEIVNGKGEFTFDDDGWFNSGKGTIETTDGINIKITTEVTKPSRDAMWSIGNATHELVLAGD